MSPKRNFRDAWMENEDYRQWLAKVEGNPHKARCNVCKTEFLACVKSLKRHKHTKFHQDNMAGINNPAVDVPAASTSTQDLVTRAEIKLAAFFAEHNIALNTADHMTDLFKDILKDPNVVQNITLKRSKATYVIKEIGQIAKDDIIEVLKASKFSIIIDETMDISTKKTCTAVVKYYDENNTSIQTRMLDLIEIYDKDDTMCEGSTGQHLFDLLYKLLNDNNIRLDNLIGFTADGPSNIMGQYNSLTSRLKYIAPGITVLKCICYSVHKCSSNAAKTLPQNCENLIRAIYTYFSHSSKRQE